MQQNEDSLDLRFFSNTRKETSQAAQLGRCSSKKDSAMLRVQFAKALPSWMEQVSDSYCQSRNTLQGIPPAE